MTRIVSPAYLLLTAGFFLFSIGCQLPPSLEPSPTPPDVSAEGATQPQVSIAPLERTSVPQDPDQEVPTSCHPTPADQLGPFYVPGAPKRSSVGEGHVLQGATRSSPGCEPIPGAQIEFWQVGPDGRYDDAHRDTMFADASGAYSFEGNIPPPYSG